nr:hypothetical protein [Tanacetum cinerariifolium]
MTPPSTHIDTTPIPIVSSTIPPSPDYKPASPDYTPASPDYSPASDTESDLSEDLSSDHIPLLAATSLFFSSTDDYPDSDIPDTPPSPTHGTPFTEIGVDPLLHLSPESTTNLEGCLEDSFKPYVPSEAGLGVDIEDESSEPSRYRGTNLEMDDDVMRSDGIDIDLKIQADINECIAYANALRDRGIDARIIVEAVDQEEIKTGARGPIREMEQDNMRLRDMMDVASQRVTLSQRRELCVQKELRQIWRFRFYDRMRIARIEACARSHLGYRS